MNGKSSAYKIVTADNKKTFFCLICKRKFSRKGYITKHLHESHGYSKYIFYNFYN